MLVITILFWYGYARWYMEYHIKKTPSKTPGVKDTLLGNVDRGR